MRNIVASEFVTLDGVMESPEKWQLGEGMQFFSDDMAKYSLDQVKSADSLLLGRVTYELFAGAWPSIQDEEGFADRMNSLPKHVVSSTLKEAEWNATLIGKNVMDEIAQLKMESGQDILLLGSAELVRSLTEAGLIDEYRIWVHPVVYGRGKRLFKNGTGATVLALTSTRTFESGVVMLTYKPSAPTDEQGRWRHPDVGSTTK